MPSSSMQMGSGLTQFGSQLVQQGQDGGQYQFQQLSQLNGNVLLQPTQLQKSNSLQQMLRASSPDRGMGSGAGGDAISNGLLTNQLLQQLLQQQHQQPNNMNHMGKHDACIIFLSCVSPCVCECVCTLSCKCSYAT